MENPFAKRSPNLSQNSLHGYYSLMAPNTLCVFKPNGDSYCCAISKPPGRLRARCSSLAHRNDSYLCNDRLLHLRVIGILAIARQWERNAHQSSRAFSRRLRRETTPSTAARAGRRSKGYSLICVCPCSRSAPSVRMGLVTCTSIRAAPVAPSLTIALIE